MRLTMGERSFDSVATSKKIAKQNVAELALRILHSENSSGGGVSSVGQVWMALFRDPITPWPSLTLSPSITPGFTLSRLPTPLLPSLTLSLLPPSPILSISMISLIRQLISLDFISSLLTQ